MRKIIKKIVAVATTLSLTAAMGVMAFAADSYTFVGNAHLFGIDADEDPAKENGWITTAEDQQLQDAGDGYYTAKFTCSAAGSYEYKLVADGDLTAWTYQLCIGLPEMSGAATVWSDNQTQFKGTFEAGEYTVVLNPSQGMIVCVQNGKVVDFTVKYHSRDEDPQNFVEPSLAAITAEGYTLDDFGPTLEAFKVKALELAGGSVQEETTTAANTDTTPANSEATTPSKPVATGDVAPIAVIATLLVAVAVVAVAAKKKEA